MAAEPNSPWSRWDAPGFQYISHNTQPPIRQFDTGFYPVVNTSVSTINRQYLNDRRLLGSNPTSNDPAFLDCLYQLPTGEQVIQQCLRDYGCCDHKCCDNSWGEKYGWAVALIVIFCIIVIIAVIISLFVWLVNRSRDKRQRELLESNNSPTPSQAEGPVDYPYGPGPPPQMGMPPGGMYHQSYAASKYQQY
uniref:CX domain-containing protein n=1 Tax=Panagrolaimus sp. JU765 TaxID=591449 RepID=A0AC34QI93_9BILA